MDYKAERRTIKGKLTFETGLHIGTGEEGDWVDATVIKTKDEKPFIPATTIAGVFRQLAEENFKDDRHRPNKRIYELFGTIQDEGGFNQASRLIFCDAFINGETQTGYRNGVAIKRDTLTARKGALFSLETVEKPTFNFKLIIDNPLEDDREILEPILAEWQAGRVAIGGDKSRGLGWLKLSDLKSVQIDTEDLDNFVNYLFGEEKEIKFEDLKTSKNQTHGGGNHIEIDYRLTFEDDLDASLIIGSGIPGFGKDADQTLVRDKDGQFFIPGSSVKGPVRAQAERIIRYWRKNPEAACDPTGKSCSDKIKAIKKNKEMKPEEIKNQSCPVCKIFGNGYLSSRIFFTDVYAQGEQVSQVMENVAIDRFTGGAAEGAKFNSEVATKINLKGKIIMKNIDRAEASLIAFTLRDWMAGEIRLGFGKMKGYGRVKLNLERITLCVQDDNWLKSTLNDIPVNWVSEGFYNKLVIGENNWDRYQVKLKELENLKGEGEK